MPPPTHPLQDGPCGSLWQVQENICTQESAKETGDGETLKVAEGRWGDERWGGKWGLTLVCLAPGNGGCSSPISPNLGAWSRERVHVCITDPERSSPEILWSPPLRLAHPRLSPKPVLGFLLLATSENGLETLAWEATELPPKPWDPPRLGWALIFLRARPLPGFQWGLVAGPLKEQVSEPVVWGSGWEGSGFSASGVAAGRGPVIQRALMEQAGLMVVRP